MRPFLRLMLGGISIAALALSVLPAYAVHRRPAHDATQPRTPESLESGNPLLPAPIAIEALWPDLAMNPKAPDSAPEGLTPNYTADDWTAYRAEYGAAADDVLRKRASQVAQFAQTLIAAAARTDQPGLKRLLLIRATVLTYRATTGNPTAQKALAAYQEAIDLTAPTQVAALWTLADGLARQISTPKSERPRFGAMAARANIQLCMLLLDANQIAAAQRVAKLLGRHEGAIRADSTLHVQANLLRTLVSQTAGMFDYLHTQYDLLARGDDSGAVGLYLYGRLVKDNPGAASTLAGHRHNAAVRQIDALYAQAAHDPMAHYALAEDLKNMAANLPDGILKHRTLYAALQSYRAFLAAPQTEPERVKRTMARMAVQTVVADGASPNPTIRPFDKPPATASAPAPTQPAAEG